jgi:hypothetical protein
MLMKEIDLEALGLTDEHAEVMDDLLPGWRELTPVEFADQMAHVSGALQDEGSALRTALEELDRRREAE